MRAEKRLSEAVANWHPAFDVGDDRRFLAGECRSHFNPRSGAKNMKRLIIAAAAVTLMTGAAFAATDAGTIKQIDPKSDAITLDDGNTFTLAEGTEAESLKVGQTVKVTYHLKSGKMVATEIVVTK